MQELHHILTMLSIIQNVKIGKYTFTDQFCLSFPFLLVIIQNCKLLKPRSKMTKNNVLSCEENRRSIYLIF